MLLPEPFSSPRYTQGRAVSPSAARIAGPTQGDGTPTPYCRGFHVITAGNVNAIFKDGQNDGAQQFPVNVGEKYDYSLAFFLPVTTGTQAVILGLW